MKFYTCTKVQGEIILTKINVPMPPPCPAIAQSVRPDAPAIIRFFVLVSVVLSCAVATITAHWPPAILTSINVYIATNWPPSVWTANKARLDVLTIIAIVIIETLAQGHLEKIMVIT